MNPEVQEKIGQIQLIQQNMQNLSMQRQQFQLQQSETESALSELEKTEKSYKIIGNIMVATKKDELKKDLEEKKQMLNVRINSIEKQESKLREKAEELQKDILEQLEKSADKKPKKQNVDNKTQA